MKLGGFRLGRACHARQFLIKPEIILDRDRRQRLRLAIDLDAFFGFHRLVQTIAPPSARHLAAGELIDDYDFVILDHVLDIFLKQAVGAEQLGDVVDALRLGVAMLLALRFFLVLLVVGQIWIKIDLGEFVDQIRQHKCVRVIWI